MKKISILKKAVTLWLAAAVVTSLTACGAEAAGDASDKSSESIASERGVSAGEDITIRVGGGYSAIYGPQIIIAQQQGFFDEAFADLDVNVKVETYQFANGPAYNEALMAGEVDAAIGIGDQPSMSGILNGDGAVIISRVITNTKGVGVVVRDDAGIESGSDLKGKVIATGLGTAYQKCLDLYLADYGLTEDDVELVNLYGTDEVLAAFQTGEIDAAATSISYIKSQAEEAGLAHLLSDFTDHPNYAYLVMNGEFVAEHEDITVKFLEALLKANDWYNANKDEAYQIIAEQLDISVEEVRITNDDVIEEMKLDEDDFENFRVTYDFMEVNDLLPATTDDLSTLYDTKYIDQAIENVGNSN